MTYRVQWSAATAEGSKTFETEEFAMLAGDMCKLDPSINTVRVTDTTGGRILMLYERPDIYATLNAIIDAERNK